jgi:CRP-like cAMP-binding protein
MVGVLSAIDSRPRPATIVALQTSLIASLKSEDFSLMVHRSPIFCDAVLEHLASVVRSLNNRVVEHATLKVSYRIRRELLRIAREGGSLQPTARLPRITHAELASRVGTHREAVTREINHLVATNVVLREGRELLVKDLVALHKAAKSSRTRSH